MPVDRRKTLATLPANRRKPVGGLGMGGPVDAKKTTRSKAKSRMSFIPTASTGMAFAINENDEHTAELPATATDSRPMSQSSPASARKVLCRKSMAPMERSSVSIAYGAHSRVDPRPVSDKAFVTESVKTVHHYLVDKGYPHSVTQKTVFRPSTRDFNNIMTFLMRRILPAFNNGSMKFEDEVATSFKFLGYGFPISKTGMASVGVPHTWPPILSAITWLVGLLEYEEKAQASKEQDSEPEAIDDSAPLEKVFFEYLGHAYFAYMTQDREELDSLKTGLRSVFDEKIECISSIAEGNADINMALEDEVKEIESKSNTLPEACEKLENLRTKLSQYREVVQNLMAHKEDIQSKVTKKESQLFENEKALKEVQTIVNNFREKVSSQPLSTEDVRRMGLEQVRLKEGLARIKETKKVNNDELVNYETELSERFEKLEEIEQLYNSIAAELQFIPISAKNSGGKKMMIEIDRKHASESNTKLLGGVNLDDLQCYLYDFKCKVALQISTNNELLAKLLDEEEASENNFAEITDHLAILEEKGKRSEETFLREKEDLDAVLTARNKETININNRIASLQDPLSLESALSKAQTRNLQLEALRREEHEENLALKAATQNEIMNALSICAEGKAYIEKQLNDLKHFMQETKSGLNVLEKPLSEDLQVGVESLSLE